ncbi:hypothetical protein BaRGS_00012609 [Batillaria attramentaria]|uniref:Uncharacterized protein n=1 Tax=Batillaria attramentaria TaxID=370345 RepID=A0ABD0L9H0_9CAEN
MRTEIVCACAGCLVLRLLLRNKRQNWRQIELSMSGSGKRTLNPTARERILQPVSLPCISINNVAHRMMTDPRSNGFTDPAQISSARRTAEKGQRRSLNKPVSHGRNQAHPPGRPAYCLSLSRRWRTNKRGDQ